jgi:hypothetical protein
MAHRSVWDGRCGTVGAGSVCEDLVWWICIFAEYLAGTEDGQVEWVNKMPEEAGETEAARYNQ